MDIKYPNWLPKTFGSVQKAEEMNLVVDVLQNHAEVLESQKQLINNIGDGVSPISIKPTTPITELNALPNAVYRAFGEGEYKFNPKLQIVEGQGLNVIPPGYSVKFLKEASGWSVSVVEKLPEVVTTSDYQGTSETLAFNQLGAKNLNNIKASKTDLGFNETPISTEHISELINSDVNDTTLWEVGLLTSTSSNTSANFRISKKYYKIPNDNQLKLKVGIYGDACCVLYDDSYNRVGYIKSSATTPSGYYEVDFSTITTAKYIKVSHFNSATYTTAGISVKNNMPYYSTSDNIFVLSSTFNEKVKNEITDTLKIEDMPVGTQFLGDYINSEITDGEFWGVGFFDSNGAISTGSANFYHTKKYIPLQAGSYTYRMFFTGNARIIVYDLDKNIIQYITGGNGVDDHTKSITFTEDVYIRFSHRESTTTNRRLLLTLTNTTVLFPIVITSENITGYLSEQSDSFKNNLRLLYKDKYRAKKKRPLVTLISDDGHKANSEWYVPILNEFNVKSTFAIVGGWVKTANDNSSSNFLNQSKIKELFDNGHDIASHTWTHTENWSTVLTLEQIEEEMSRNKVYLESITSTSVNMFISPFGLRTTAIDNIISKYYDANFISGYASRNELPLDNYFINRVAFDSSETNPVLKWDSVIKPAIDSAIENNEWLIFAVHPQYTQYNTWDQKEARKAELRTLLQYCKDNGVEVVTAKKGYEYYRNHVDIGVKRVNASYYKLAMDMTEENINYF